MHASTETRGRVPCGRAHRLGSGRAGETVLGELLHHLLTFRRRGGSTAGQGTVVDVHLVDVGDEVVPAHVGLHPCRGKLELQTAGRQGVLHLLRREVHSDLRDEDAREAVGRGEDGEAVDLLAGLLELDVLFEPHRAFGHVVHGPHLLRVVLDPHHGAPEGLLLGGNGGVRLGRRGGRSRRFGLDPVFHAPVEVLLPCLLAPVVLGGGAGAAGGGEGEGGDGEGEQLAHGGSFSISQSTMVRH